MSNINFARRNSCNRCGKDMLDCVVSTNRSKQRRAFVSLVGSGDLVSLLIAERPHCAFFVLAGLSVSDVDDQVGTFFYEDALDRVMSDKGGNGWLNACALIHNKEMHAKNGNIDRPNDVASSEAMVEHLRALFWDTPVTTYSGQSKSKLLQDCENGFPRLFYSDFRYAGNTYLDNAGTIHQWVGHSDAILSCITNIVTDGGKKDQAPSASGKKPLSAVEEVSSTPEKPPLVVETPELCRPHTPALGSSDEVGSVVAPLARAKEELKQLCSEVRWVGVGYNEFYNHGSIVNTTTPNTLNLRYGYLPQVDDTDSDTDSDEYVARLNFRIFLMDLARCAESVRVDWRELGIRVALYEDLRHNDCVHPTGVNWAWPERRVPEKTIVPLTSLDMVHYEAVFVSGQALAASMRENDGDLLVGRPDIAVPWSTEETRIISLPADAGITWSPGQDIWVLSHLEYPLAWVFDSYAIREGAGSQPTEEMFLRTAGLVDIPCRARKIIFVVPQYKDKVCLGGRDFKIGKTDRHGNPDINNPPLSYNIDNELETILRRVLTSNVSLRNVFNQYTRYIFVGGLNWLEIDSLVSALTVRWHPRVETYCDGDGNKKYRGAPANILETMFNGIPDKDGQTTLRLKAYGGRVAVTSLDCVVSLRDWAQSNPHIILGRWSNMAELMVGMGLCVYRTCNVEEKADINSRLSTGLHDRLMRSRFLRKVVECWKREHGLTDEIAFPGQHDDILHYWDRFLTSKAPIFGLKNLVEVFITSTVRYSWGVNTIHTPQGASLTGVRTPSSWWRTKLSTEWGGFSIGATGRTVGAAYELDDRRCSRFYDRWIQTGVDGTVDVALESALNRLNLENRHWDLSYRTHPNSEERLGVSWLVETNRTAMIAQAAGWRGQCGQLQDPLVWGWGVASIVWDWKSGNWLTITVPKHVSILIEANSYRAGTWLSRGIRNLPNLSRTDASKVLGFTKDYRCVKD